ncbi:hypothetical protein, partial [Streptomyces sp. NPDC086787]|uniref:hypothetical protein n=1 Tax=Streptomyces sp. NPDC086787 TaxID=3365759 RepID=UPI0038301420
EASNAKAATKAEAKDTRAATKDAKAADKVEASNAKAATKAEAKDTRAATKDAKAADKVEAKDTKAAGPRAQRRWSGRKLWISVGAAVVVVITVAAYLLFLYFSDLPPRDRDWEWWLSLESTQPVVPRGHEGQVDILRAA